MAKTDATPPTEVILNEANFEVLVAKFVPTSQYFERSFQMLQNQMEEFKEGQRDFKSNVDMRFDENRSYIDRRFDETDLKIQNLRDGQKELKADMDKRFEQVDKRFEQVNAKLDTIIERLDVKIDAGLRENRSMSMRLFSFAMVFSAISMAGLMGKISGLF